MSQPYSSSSADDDAIEPMIGEYANYVSVGSIQTEFYIDFMQTVPGTAGEEDQVMPVRRILISPMLIRGLVRALEQEISNYESTYTLTLPTVES